MKNLLKVIIVCFVLVSISACSNKKQAKDTEKYSVKDSILLSNIRKFRKFSKDDIGEGLLVLKFNKRSSDEFSFTIRILYNYYEFMETELKNKQYIFVDSKPVIVSDYMNNRSFLGTKTQKIDSVFIKSVLPLLAEKENLRMIDAISWVVSYNNGKVDIFMCPVGPPGSSIYD